MYQQKDYDEFAAKMESSYPSMFAKPYGGFAIGPGWWPIIESLCKHIYSYTEYNQQIRELLLKSNPYNVTIPDAIQPVVVRQIKEKFGGLRFYYDGGNDRIMGMVTMAEVWAAHTCEECGKPGKLRSGGWFQTLCDEHEAERQERMKNIK
jgi:hypothetical protein